MPDIRNCQRDPVKSVGRENIAIDTYRILDSCKDKDCYEEVKVFLTDFGQEILDKSGSIKVTNTKVVWCDIFSEPVRFNRGFYQISIRFFTKVTFEVCTGVGKSQEIDGIAVTEKKVVLYGGDGCVNVFKSSDDVEDVCSWGSGGKSVSSCKPTVVVEAVDPIALSVHIRDSACHCQCCCFPDEIPDHVLSCIHGNICDSITVNSRILTVSLGFFTVVRVERPIQMIVCGTEYAVPDKICTKTVEDDPCSLFAKMSFPVNEFMSMPPCSEEIDCCKP
jgi:hypothetical protein